MEFYPFYNSFPHHYRSSHTLFASLFSFLEKEELFLEWNTTQAPDILSYLIFVRILGSYPMSLLWVFFLCKKQNSSHEYIVGLDFLPKQNKAKFRWFCLGIREAPRNENFFELWGTATLLVILERSVTKASRNEKPFTIKSMKPMCGHCIYNLVHATL